MRKIIGVFIVAIIAIMLVSNHVFAEVQVCKEWSYLYDHVMYERQQGLNKDAALMDVDHPHIKHVIKDAYTYPIAESTMGKFNIIDEFVKKWFERCMYIMQNN